MPAIGLSLRQSPTKIGVQKINLTVPCTHFVCDQDRGLRAQVTYTNLLNSGDIQPRSTGYALALELAVGSSFINISCICQNRLLVQWLKPLPALHAKQA